MYEDQINRALGIFEHKNNVREHYYCVKDIFAIYNTKERLEQLLKRPDIDTVCAWDYQRMKQYALKGEGLSFVDYHPEYRGVDKIPQL